MHHIHPPPLHYHQQQGGCDSSQLLILFVGELITFYDSSFAYRFTNPAKKILKKIKHILIKNMYDFLFGLSQKLKTDAHILIISIFSNYGEVKSSFLCYVFYYILFYVVFISFFSFYFSYSLFFIFRFYGLFPIIVLCSFFGFLLVCVCVSLICLILLFYYSLLITIYMLYII